MSAIVNNIVPRESEFDFWKKNYLEQHAVNKIINEVCKLPCGNVKKKKKKTFSFETQITKVSVTSRVWT